MSQYQCWSRGAVRSGAVNALLVGISGGSGSGKTRLTNDLAAAIGPDRVSILPFDAYYKDLRYLSPEERTAVNFDHPDSLDAEMFGHHLDGLANGLDIAMPMYDFNTHRRMDDLQILPAKEIIIAEGILLFAFPELVERFDLTIFRSCPEDVRYARRLERDMVDRGRDEASVKAQFDASVRPMHDQFVQPSAALANRVVEHGESLETVVAELALQVQAISV